MDDNIRAKLAEISAQWRSAGKIGPAVSKSVSQAYELGKAEGIKEGMRRAAEICRARAVKLAPEHTAHTGDGCYDCGAEDEADYLALAILKEAGE